MIRHDIHDTHGAFVYECENEQLAAMIYSRTSPTLIIVEHTEVSAVLKSAHMVEVTLPLIMYQVQIESE